MDKKKKLTLQLFLGAFLVLVGVVLLFLGFYAPAVGEIANSVLVAYGEVSTFAGALIGVDYKYKYQVYKLDEEERIRHKDNSEEV